MGIPLNSVDSISFNIFLCCQLPASLTQAWLLNNPVDIYLFCYVEISVFDSKGLTWPSGKQKYDIKELDWIIHHARSLSLGTEQQGKKMTTLYKFFHYLVFTANGQNMAQPCAHLAPYFFHIWCCSLVLGYK